MDLKEQLKEFIESKDHEFKFNCVLPICTIFEILSELGLEDNGKSADYVYGWELNFIYKFNSKYTIYILEGSLWYGDYLLTIQENE